MLRLLRNLDDLELRNNRLIIDISEPSTFIRSSASLKKLAIHDIEFDPNSDKDNIIKSLKFFACIHELEIGAVCFKEVSLGRTPKLLPNVQRRLTDFEESDWTDAEYAEELVDFLVPYDVLEELYVIQKGDYFDMLHSGLSNMSRLYIFFTANWVESWLGECDLSVYSSLQSSWSVGLHHINQVWDRI